MVDIKAMIIQKAIGDTLGLKKSNLFHFARISDNSALPVCGGALLDRKLVFVLVQPHQGLIVTATNVMSPPPPPPPPPTTPTRPASNTIIRCSLLFSRYFAEKKTVVQDRSLCKSLTELNYLPQLRKRIVILDRFLAGERLIWMIGII